AVTSECYCYRSPTRSDRARNTPIPRDRADPEQASTKSCLRQTQLQSSAQIHAHRRCNHISSLTSQDQSSNKLLPRRCSALIRLRVVQSSSKPLLCKPDFHQTLMHERLVSSSSNQRAPRRLQLASLSRCLSRCK